MRMYKPRDFVWSSEDRAEYAKWRRGVFVVYGCIGLVAIAAMVAIRFVGGQ
jgi:hypothetical protein